uniref:Uncharacterized protein n=1 Tax=Chelydra serpentina TaxID=8475 RepID=A0A8C3RVS5_CHESE
EENNVIIVFGAIWCVYTLVFGGAFVILTYKNYKSFFWDCFLVVPGWLAIASAFLLLPTGALALCISTRNSRYHQGTFMYLLVVLFCLEASSAVLAHVYSDRMSSELNRTMGHLFHQDNGTYSHHPGSRAVDILQRQLQCCGVHNYTDWAEAAASQPVRTGNICAPKSCCKETYSACTGDLRQSEQLFQEGCLRKLEWPGPGFYLIKLILISCICKSNSLNGVGN